MNCTDQRKLNRLKVKSLTFILPPVGNPCPNHSKHHRIKSGELGYHIQKAYCCQSRCYSRESLLFTAPILFPTTGTLPNCTTATPHLSAVPCLKHLHQHVFLRETPGVNRIISIKANYHYNQLISIPIPEQLLDKRIDN